ncbi:hypothetical protein ACFX2I_044746 [Malus domestica]
MAESNTNNNNAGSRNGLCGGDSVDPNILLTSFAKAGKHAQLLRVHSDSGHHRSHFSNSVGNSSTGNVNRSVKPPPQDNQYRLGDGGSGYGYGTKSNQYRLVDGSSGSGYVSKSNQCEQDRSLVTKTHQYHRLPPLAPPVGGDSDQCSIM